MARTAQRFRGVTLIEVLIVIAIIGLLVSLMVPAIQASREVARRTQCSNNLKQLGLAFRNFEDKQKAFPSVFTMRISGPLKSDPGLAAYDYFVDLLPFLEETGIEGQYRKDALFCAAENQPAISHPLAVAICPSAPDRGVTTTFKYQPSLALPTGAPSAYGHVYALLDQKYATTYAAGVTDYAVPEQVEDGFANMHGYKVPKNAAAGLQSMFPSPLNLELVKTFWRWQAIMDKPGTVELSARTRASQITDGLSHTMMMTEVGGRPEHWEMGMHTGRLAPLRAAWADPSAAMFNIRGIQVEDRKCAMQCANTSEDDGEIYSFHSDGANFLFADGRVEFISAGTEPRVIFAFVTPAGGDNEK